MSVNLCRKESIPLFSNSLLSINLNLRSLRNHNMMIHVRSGQVMVDLDGPGPVPPSLVTCELEAGHKVRK